jgi:hypothetical protein
MASRSANGAPSRPFIGTVTSKRRRLVRLCAGDREFATTAYSSQPRVSPYIAMAKKNKKGRRTLFRGHRLMLDDLLSDFPSLSTAPQAQQNSSAQQAWSNTNMRGGGGGPQLPHAIQRPQMQTPSQNQNAPSSSQHQQLQGQLHEDGSSATQGQFPSAGDDFRFGGQQGVGQLSGGAQAQTGSIDDFPPLGAGEGNVAPDRRLGMIQNAAGYGNSALTGTFPGLGHTRNGLSSPTDAQQDRAGPSAVGSRGMQSGEGNTTSIESTFGGVLLTSILGAQNAYGMAREAMRIQDADRVYIHHILFTARFTDSCSAARPTGDVIRRLTTPPECARERV